MSLQHFYSRVPARVSLFNKRDGFDTFAHSVMLDGEFIRRTLAPAYEGKLEIHDPVRIRRGQIPMVYSQTVLETGDVAQTAIRYIPKDFTGERSAYIAHTLVLTEEEREAVFFRPDTDAFNPAMFYTDITGFRITERNAAGNPSLIDTPYQPRPLSDGLAVISKYNPEMVKSLIFAVVSSIIGDGREVYFRLPGEDIEASETALELINAIMSVLPYSLRQRLSFVSYVSSVDAYPGFKLKGVGADVDTVPPEKGVFFDFVKNEVIGQAVDYYRYISQATFMHSLFEYPVIKDEFHSFFEGIVRGCEGLTLDLESFKEIVFIFWQCSGRYVENSILPSDEAIAGFLDTYEKYRVGIEVENRVQAYRCLARYSAEQIAIPDNVFSRLTRLYPGECVEAKAVALDVLLSLIHVDLMRTSLFCFISRFYAGETDAVKAVVISNLCRVFYGGFLQQNILAFFDLYFRREPAHVKDIILDKLLLSIRTPEIQGQIVSFLDRHYPALNQSQKLKICSTCLEMIPECDGLSVMLVNLINRRICREVGDIPRLMDERLSEALTYGLLSGDGRIAAIMVDNPGFCEDIVLRHAIEQQAGVDMIIGILAAMPAHKRIDKLLRAYAIAKLPREESFAALIHRFTLVPVAVWPSFIWEVLERDAEAARSLPAEALDYFRRVIVYPAVNFTLHHAFKLVDGSCGLDPVLKYAEEHPEVAGSGEYKLILDYLEMIRKCNIGDTEAAFKLAYGLPESPEVRGDIAAYIKKKVYNHDDCDLETSMTYELLINYLSGDSFNFDLIYTRYQMELEDMRVEQKNLKSIMADRGAALEAIDHIISCASAICDASDALADMVNNDESGLRSAIKDFIELYGPGAGVYLKKKTRDTYFAIEEIAEELIEQRNATISSVGDAVNFLLRKK